MTPGYQRTNRIGQLYSARTKEVFLFRNFAHEFRGSPLVQTLDFVFFSPSFSSIAIIVKTFCSCRIYCHHPEEEGCRENVIPRS